MNKIILTILCIAILMPNVLLAQAKKSKTSKIQNSTQVGIKYENEIVLLRSLNKLIEKKNDNPRFNLPCTTIREITTYNGNVRESGKKKSSGILKLLENGVFSENCQNYQYGKVDLDFKVYSYRLDTTKSPYTITVTKYTEKNNNDKDIKILLESDNELERYASQIIVDLDKTKQMFGNQVISKTDFTYKISRNYKPNTDMFETTKKTIDTTDGSVLREEYNVYLINSNKDAYTQLFANNRDSEVSINDKKEMMNIAKSLEFK